MRFLIQGMIMNLKEKKNLENRCITLLSEAEYLSNVVLNRKFSETDIDDVKRLSEIIRERTFGICNQCERLLDPFN